MLSNEVYSVSQGFKYLSTIFGDEISSFCAYDHRVLLCGSPYQKIGVYIYHEGTY
jgi:hypothetical protein